MIRPDEKTLKAIINVQNNSDWKTLRLWLEQCHYEILLQATTIKDDVENRWKQGEAKLLMEFLAIIDNARTDIDRIEKNKNV